jgi:hypothetical protein
MNIGIVGGLDRNAWRCVELARAEGHALECHRGWIAGTGHDSLESLVVRCDVLIVITDVNSHAAVWLARDLARAHGKPLKLVRRLGISRLRELIASLPRAA